MPPYAALQQHRPTCPIPTCGVCSPSPRRERGPGGEVPSPTGAPAMPAARRAFLLAARTVRRLLPALVALLALAAAGCTAGATRPGATQTRITPPTTPTATVVPP